MSRKWGRYFVILAVVTVVLAPGIFSLVSSLEWVGNDPNTNQEEFIYKEFLPNIGTEIVGAVIIFVLFEIALIELRGKIVREQEVVQEIMDIAEQGDSEELKRRLLDSNQALQKELPKMLEPAEMTAVLKCLVGEPSSTASKA